MSLFVDRVLETKELHSAFASNKAELILVFGRRRIGKSRLLVEAIKNKNAVYFLADSSKSVLDSLAKQVNNKFVRFSNWDDFFEFIKSSEFDVIVIDEFQYLCDVEKAWLSILQRHWETIKYTNKKIILCGSIISSIFKLTKGYGSALYGRFSKEFKIMPLEFVFLREFFKKYSAEDLIKVYCILGGIPRYWEEFDDSKSINENILEKIFNKNSFLYNEPMNLLFEEFRDVSPYISIILAITQGNVKFNEIASASRIDSNKLSKYLTILERVDLIEKEIVVNERKLKSKITRYKVKDAFFCFWFKFVFNYKSLIERGLSKEAFNAIENDLNSYYAFNFEEICKQFLIKNKLFDFTRIGKWWLKDTEIDLIALNNKNNSVLFCECKWKEKVNAVEIAGQLNAKIKLFNWKNSERTETIALFAKSFSKEINSFDGKKVICFDLKHIVKN